MSIIHSPVLVSVRLIASVHQRPGQASIPALISIKKQTFQYEENTDAAHSFYGEIDKCMRAKRRELTNSGFLPHQPLGSWLPLLPYFYAKSNENRLLHLVAIGEARLLSMNV